MHRFPASFLAFIVSAVALSAQVSDPSATATAPAQAGREASGIRGTITANPFAMLAGYFSGDAEFKVQPGATLGIGATVNTIDDYNNYRALDVKMRFYPNETAPKGFSVAATFGISTASNTDAWRNGQRTERRFTRPSVGTEFSYQWVLGPTSQFAVVLGAGVKRMLGEEGSFDPINIPLLPMARASIGYAFR